MGGGLMQLVAYGAQDVYLTGNPNITFFKVVYRRHTNFSIETIEQTLGGNPDFGRKSTVTVLRNGDLATKIALRVRLNSVSQTRTAQQCMSVAWVRRLGHALLDNVECEIGGSKIDKQYGHWLDIWYELTHDVNQERGYRALIGDVDELVKLVDVPVDGGVVLPEYTLMVPLQFWFNRNTGLALPLIALQYHEVRLNFEFTEAAKLVVWKGDTAPNMRNFSMKDASILVDYVYCDSEERRRYAQVGHEYLIEQVQFTGEETLSDSGNGSNINSKVKLGFNHPCKELIWALKNGAFNGDRGSKFLTYTHDDAKWESEALQAAADNVAHGMFQVNAAGGAGTSITASQQGVVYTGNGATVAVNVFCVDQSGTPVTPGSVGMTAFKLECVTNPLVNGSYNLGTKINNVDVVVQDNSGADPVPSIISVKVTNHSLNLNDVSVPLEDWVDNRVGDLCHDVAVIQFHNYGVRLDGKGNPVQEGNIQLNGQDRFDVREGAYFNYLQPLYCHKRTPADGVNVYAFALNPEQHQPSGSCNLSRIDNTLLIMKFVDPLRTGAVPKLSLSRDSKYYIYALSYNILRIMSGMGDLEVLHVLTFF
jgi:hypothetical protein